MHLELITYTLDQDDKIISLSGNWEAFAQANQAGDELKIQKILGRSIWEFIQGIETNHLYNIIFQRIREGKPTTPFPFRCDSPALRRYLTLVIELLPQGHLKIESRTISVTPREAVILLDKASLRSESLVTLCSMCKKMKISENDWAEIEDGIRKLELFGTQECPQISHGLCKSCYEMALSNWTGSGRTNSSSGRFK